MTGGVPGEGVLVVIPCLDEAAHLPRLLAQFAGDAPGARVVVADGGSTDASVAIARGWAGRHPAIALLDNPARIQSAAINLAVRRFGGDRRWLVRIDAHCDYPSGYVEGLLAAARRHDATSVVVPMRTRGRGCFQRAVAAAQNSRLGTGGSAHRHVGAGRFVDHGHHALMRLDLFAAVGGYCPHFPHNEDAELDYRLARAGGRIWLEPSLALDYWPRTSVAALFRQYLGYGRGRARTMARHRLWPRRRQAAPIAVAPAVGLALLSPWLGWWLALPAGGWASLALGYGVVLGIRARCGCAALSGVAATTMHLAWSLGFLRQVVAGRHPGPGPQPIAFGGGHIAGQTADL